MHRGKQEILNFTKLCEFYLQCSWHK